VHFFGLFFVFIIENSRSKKQNCSNMFQFTRKPSSGSYNQYLAKNYTLG